MPNMGSFGNFTQYYRESHEMTPFESEDAEPELQELRAAQYADRMRATFEDHDTRKLLLRFDPPPIYQMAQYANQVTASATNQINYLFAEGLLILREPGTQRLVVTVDREVALRLETVHGYAIEPFVELRTLADAEARVAALPASVESEQPAEAVLDEDEAELADALNALVGASADAGGGEQLSVPGALSSTFRTDVMGAGPLRAFQPLLFAAVDERCTWDGRAYAPLVDWSPGTCKQRWSDAAPAEANRWEQAVLEMRQAYCLLRRHALGESVWGENGVPQAIRDGSASWTAVRALTKAYFKREGASGNDMCQSACRVVVNRVQIAAAPAAGAAAASE